MGFTSLNEILAAAANIGHTPQEIDALKISLKNDTTGKVREEFLERLRELTTIPKEKTIRWQRAEETEASRKELKGSLKSR